MATYLQGDTKISIIPGPFLKSDTFEFLNVRVNKPSQMLTKHLYVPYQQTLRL